MIRWCCFLSMVFCTAAMAQHKVSILSGTTPCGKEIKVALGIGDKACESVKWKMTMSVPDKFSFVAVYGEGLPNSMDYKGGGTKSEGRGTYQISSSGLKKTICELNSVGLKSPLLLWQLDGDIFHFLGNDKKVLTGDGGHNYTLNRVE